MKIDKQLLDNLTAQAKVSPRLRMNLDLRNSDADSSQRMLNAIEPGSVVPIHRHQKTSETVVILRGRAVQYIYDEEGRQVEAVLLSPMAGECPVKSDMTETEEGMTESEAGIPAMQVEKGQWHALRSLESGTVILEMKDGAYEPISPADILSM